MIETTVISTTRDASCRGVRQSAANCGAVCPQEPGRRASGASVQSHDRSRSECAGPYEDRTGSVFYLGSFVGITKGADVGRKKIAGLFGG